MRFLLPLLLLLALPAQAQTSAEFLARFDELLVWMDEHAALSKSGLLLRDAEGYYEATLPLRAVEEDEFVGEPEDVGYVADSLMFGRYVLVTDSLQAVYLSEDENFEAAERVSQGEPLTELYQWHFVRANTDSVTFYYAHLYTSVYLVNSLLQIHERTRRARYLDRAEQMLLGLSELVGEDGKWYRWHLKDSGPTYTGMAQGIVMRVTHRFLQRREVPALEAALRRMALGFEHTTEGTLNHWTNSVMGQLVRDAVLDTSATDFSEVGDVLTDVYRRIDEFEGRIPYVINEDHPSYPLFKATYQTYDTYLLALLAWIAPVDIGFRSYFDAAFEEAVQVNYGQYVAHNTKAALAIYRAYEHDVADFMASQRANRFVWNEPSSPQYALAQIQVLSALLLYEHLVEESRTSSEPPTTAHAQVSEPYPNPVTSRTVIEVVAPTTEHVHLRLYDTLGRLVHSTRERLLRVGTSEQFEIDADGVANGLYVYRVTGETFFESGSLVVVK